MGQRIFRVLRALMSLALLAPLAAAAAPPTGAYSIPVSNRMIQGEIIRQGRAVRFAVLDGGMFKTREADGPYLGFTFTIVDPETQRIAIKAFEITEHGPGLEALRRLGEAEAEVGELTVFDEPTYIELRVTTLAMSNLTMGEVERLRHQLDPGSALFGDREEVEDAIVASN